MISHFFTVPLVKYPFLPPHFEQGETEKSPRASSFRVQRNEPPRSPCST